MKTKKGRLKSMAGEYSQRITRAQILMRKYDLDGLLLAGGSNLVYFAGISGPLAGRSGSRPTILLLPQVGEPILIVQEGLQFVARASSVIQNIRTYYRLSYLPNHALFCALKDLGLTQGKIGCELGGEMVLDLPFQEFLHFTQEVNETEFIDASSLLWDLRMIKSTAEIKRIARACEVTGLAYEKTFNSIHVGMTEREIERVHRINMLNLGGNEPWVMILSGEGNYDLIGKSGADRVIEPGDLVWIDSGCSVDGYWSDFSRAGVVGYPSSDQKEAQQHIHEITKLGIEMVRPGVSVSEIAQFCNSSLEATSFPISSGISKLAARVGHGIGLDITEPPSLNEEDPATLEPGMVVSIEPGVATEFGTFHTEEDVLVTNNGYRVLSSAKWELWPISVNNP
jgi:Xaa-Pro dipeptidase